MTDPVAYTPFRENPKLCLWNIYLFLIMEADPHPNSYWKSFRRVYEYL